MKFFSKLPRVANRLTAPFRTSAINFAFAIEPAFGSRLTSPKYGNPPPGPSRVQALLVGVRSVDPKSPTNNGWDGSAIAKGVTSNIRMMENLFQKQLYHSPAERMLHNTQTLIEPQDITKRKILDQLSNYSTSMQPGDLFIFYFSGHGRFNSFSHGTLCCYDTTLWDSDLKEIWKKFKPGVRIVMMADSCESGSTDALFNKIRLKEHSNVSILSHDPDRKNINAMLIYFSPVDESRNTYSTDEGGYFTRAIINVMNKGHYQGNYKNFYNDIQKEMARLTAGQTYKEQPIVLNPQYDELGPTETAAFQKFREQRPFTLHFPNELLPHISVDDNEAETVLPTPRL